MVGHTRQTWLSALTYDTTRKLTAAGQVMNTMTTQENFAQFLNVPENAQRINHLVEDVRYALMEYQVCAPENLNPILSNTCLRLHYNKRSMTRVVS